MKLDFLQGRVSLTKTFSQEKNSITKSSYPHVFKFNSSSIDVENLSEMAKTIKAYGEQGYCLLKGQLLKDLIWESRAGSTDPTESTEWIVLDIDDLDGFEDAEDLVKELPAAFQEASYIVQYSASYGITEGGLRAHLFFMLENPVAPSQIKEWTQEFNLEKLRNQLTLTATKRSLRWPVDITVGQNDKLIYIAPPRCVGINDPVTERLRIVEKEKDLLDFTFPSSGVAAISYKVEKAIAELRKKEGLPKTATKTAKGPGGALMITNPEAGTVTSSREERGFVYLNLNGGDSWGYYFKAGNPKVLYNFKDEPPVELEKIDPAWYADYCAARAERPLDPEEGIRVLAFRDHKTDTYFGGFYDPKMEKVFDLERIGTKDRIGDFCLNNNEVAPDPIPDWVYEFRPDSDKICDPPNRFVNRWQPTEYMKWGVLSEEIPPTIKRVLMSVCGDDAYTVDKFVNWLACILQKREKIGTAWVLHGTQGTGKGLLFHKIIAPIFGHNHCATKQIKDLRDQFNSWMETCLILNIDEARVFGKDASEMTNNLKYLITEPTINIRKMYAGAQQHRNYTNLIITSNDYDSVHLEESDRRHHVAPRQENKLEIGQEEITRIDNELLQFAGYLRGHKADMEDARKVETTQAKTDLYESGMKPLESILHAVHTGNLDYFLTSLDMHIAVEENMGKTVALKNIVERWMSFANTENRCVVRHKELFVVYRYTQNDHVGETAFKRMLRSRNEKNEVHKENGKAKRGIETLWCASEDIINSVDIYDPNKAKPEDLRKVVSINKSKAAPET